MTDRQTPSDTPVARPARDRRTRLFLILATILDVLALPLAAFWGMMSVMASDAGTSPFVETYIWINLSLPLAMILCPIAAWIAWFRRKNRLAVILMVAPLAWVVFSVAMLAAWPPQ